MSSMGSYYTADYYQNPTPYESSDIGEPVPGWGTTVSIAGPSRLGVGAYGVTLSLEAIRRAGAAARRKSVTTVSTQDADTSADDTSAEDTSEPSKPLPWWIWPAAAAVVLGGVGYYGTKKGWL